MFKAKLQNSTRLRLVYGAGSGNVTGAVGRSVGLLLLSSILTACDRGGESSAANGSGVSAASSSAPVSPIPPLTVNNLAPLRTTQGESIVRAEVLIQTLAGVELVRAVSSDIPTGEELEPAESIRQTGYIDAVLPEVVGEEVFCHITVSGGELLAADNDQLVRRTNDTAPEAVYPCAALDGDADPGGVRVDGGLKVNFFSSAILQTLRLYAPLSDYESVLAELLDNIAAEVVQDLRFDANGDATISYLEMSAAPSELEAKLDLDALYRAIRRQAQAYLRLSPTDLPNIVMIVADDIGYGDVSVFWDQSDILTPGIDQIAKNGAAFTNFHVYPICAATRAAMLSGRLVHTMRVPGVGGPAEGGIPRFAPTIPEYLRQAGYRTGAFGKWHLSRRQGFLPHQRGFAQWMGFYGGGSLYSFEEISGLGGNFFVDGDQAFNLAKGHTTDVIADRAIDFIRQNRDEPLFVYLSFNAAHVPLWSEDAPVFSARPDWLQTVKADGVIGNRKQDYVALVRHMDARIEDLISVLADLNIEQNTVVIFTSDNGADVSFAEDPNIPIGSNAFFRGGKTTLYEGGIRVPMAIQWPAIISAGQSIDRFTSLLDVWPTLRDVAHIARRENDPTAPHRGQSLMPLITGGESSATGDRSVFFSFPFGGMTVIDYPWKLVRIKGRLSLYNLADDPAESKELNDLQPGKLAKMILLLERYLEEARS